MHEVLEKPADGATDTSPPARQWSPFDLPVLEEAEPQPERSLADPWDVRFAVPL
jgi:hypothetical protein